VSDTTSPQSSPAPTSPGPNSAGPALATRRQLEAAIVVGGIGGALLRAGVFQALPSSGQSWPWGTFAVNVAGSALLGAVVTVLHERLPRSTLHRALLGTGFCGALTTFSTLSLDAVRLVHHGHVGLAAAYVTASVAAGLVALSLTTLAVGRVGPR
jgi:CrcB protein